MTTQIDRPGMADPATEVGAGLFGPDRSGLDVTIPGPSGPLAELADDRPMPIAPDRQAMLVAAGLALVMVVGLVVWAVLDRNDPGGPLETVERSDTTPVTTSVPTQAPATLASGSSAPATSAPSASSGPLPGSAPAEPTAPAPDAALTLRGWGPIRAGMTVAEAEAAIGRPIVETAQPTTECRYAEIADVAGGPRLMVLVDHGELSAGSVARIELTDGRTRSGIGLGSTRDDVLAAYGDRIEITPHEYAPNGEYLTFVPVDAGDADYRMVFEVVDGAVTAIRSGLLPAVSWMESCA